MNLRDENLLNELVDKMMEESNDKITNNQELSQKEVMYFAYISIFVKEKHAKETMEKIANLFSRIKKLNRTLN